MNGVKFEFNSAIIIVTILTEDDQSAYEIIPSIFDDVIVNKIIYLPIFTGNLVLNFQSLALKVEHFIRF